MAKVQPIIGVYKITSPSGKVYIGSSKNIHRRLRHYKLLRCREQVKIYHSLIKHGVDNHKFEIIHECSPDELLEYEAYFGAMYDTLSINKGLNLRLPSSGDKYPTMTEEGLAKMREATLKQWDEKGRPSDHPEYHAKRLAKKRVRENKKYSATRKVPTEKQFENRSTASQAGWLNPDRQVKRLTEKEKAAKKIAYQLIWRARNKEKNNQYARDARSRNKDNREAIERKKQHDKAYREKTKESGREKRAAANKKWYEKKKLLPSP